MVYFTVIKWYGPDKQCFLMAELESGSGIVFIIIIICIQTLADILSLDQRMYLWWSVIHVPCIYMHAR